MQAGAKTTTGLNAHTAWIPPVAGLVAAAWIAWEACPLPLPSHLASVVIASVAYVIAALATGYLATRCGFWFTPQRPELDAGWLARHTASIAVLFPALVIVSLQRSRWAVLLGLLAILGISQSMDALQSAAEGARAMDVARLSEFQSEVPAQPMFQFPEPQWMVRHIAPFIATGVLLQLAALAYAIQERFLMMAFLGAGSLVLSWSASARAIGRKRSRRGTGKWRLLFSTLLALILTLAGLVRWFEMAYPTVPDSLLSDVVQLVFQDYREIRPRPAQRVNPVPEQTGFGSGGIFSGVILWDRKPKAIMLAPPLPQLYPEAFRDQPVTIPFSGYYSFFKPPLHRAPLGSTRMHGSPVKVGLRSSDQYPLLMEAHQDFGNLVDLACCSNIQLVVSSADHEPGPIWCELLLANKDVPASPALSLGLEMVAKPASGQQAAEETLSFNVPRSVERLRFNEMTVRYHLMGAHEQNSARIAVERFVFIPTPANAETSKAQR